MADRPGSKAAATEPPASGPTRTCVACRTEAPRDELERFVFDERVGLVHDLRKKAPGRGAYVHPTTACIEAACERGGFSRGFKRRVTADAAALGEQVRQAIEQRALETARVALRSGAMVAGGESVAEAMRHDQARLIVLAEDAGESTFRKFASNADRKDVQVLTWRKAAEWGNMFDRDRVSVLTVTDPDLADRIWRDAIVAHGDET